MNLYTSDETKQLATLNALKLPLDAERERELIAIAYGHASKKVTAAASKLVDTHVKDAAAIKKALKRRLMPLTQGEVDKHVRALKRKDRAQIAGLLAQMEITAHGLAFEEDPQFMRALLPTLVNAKEKELHLGIFEGAEEGTSHALHLHSLPDALFDELPKLRKKHPFDRVRIFSSDLSTLPDRFVELAPYMKHLYLDGTFTSLPDAVCECTNLETLHFESHYTRALNPSLEKLAKLKELKVNFGKKMTDLPLEVCELRWLERLELMFSLERLPPELAKLTKLRHLELSSLQLEPLPPELGALALTSVRLFSTSVTAADAKKLWPKAKIVGN